MKPPPFLRAIASAMSGRLATAAVNYGLFWHLARTVDAPTLGGFSLLMSLFLIISLLPMLGVSTPFMRRMSVSADAIPLEVSNAIVFSAPIVLVLLTCIGCWGQISSHQDLRRAYWMVAATLIPGAWIVVAECTLLAQERIRDITRANLLEVLIRTALAIVAIHFGYGIDGVIAAILVSRCACACIYLIHPCVPLPRLRLVSMTVQRRNWGEVPIYLGIAVVAGLVARLDVVMVSYLRSLSDAATYAAASRLYEAAQMLPTVTALVVMPVLARRHVHAPESIPETLALAVRLSLALGLGAAVFVSALAQPLVNLVYRPEMAGAGPVLGCLAFAAALMVDDVILSWAMIATNAQTADLHSLAIGLAVLAAALLVLVPAFGPTGAAAAVTLGVAVRVAMRLRWAVRALGLPSPWPSLARLAVACAAAGWTESITRGHGAVVAGLSGLAAYVATATLSGEMGHRFAQDLRSGAALFVQRG